MRARHPDQEGYVEREGVKIHYEVFGDGGLSHWAPVNCVAMRPDGKAAASGCYDGSIKL